IVVEKLKKNLRNTQRLIEKDFSVAQSFLDTQKQRKHTPKESSPEDMDIDSDNLQDLLTHLYSLKQKTLYSKNRWKDLVTMFRSAAYTLVGLPSNPLIYTLIETGISSLKTHACTSDNIEDYNKNCPICNSKALKILSKDLPYSYHTISHLICRISGAKMDDNNPPMCLPNGYVYSYSALKAMADQNQNIVVCPRTGDSFAFADCKKLYIV
ncbi:hypothetical protein BB560_006240, partial [Smittium megazygosporum]